MLDQLYLKAQTMLQKSLENVRGNERLVGESLREMGRLPLYLFCCIKAQRTHSNLVFSEALAVYWKNQAHYRQVIKDHGQLRSINETLATYANSEHQPSHQTKQGYVGDLLTPCSVFEEHMREQGTTFEYKQRVESMMVEYYLPESEQVVLVASPFSEHHIS